jgi:Rps23 Pro-64 3,4-dihydroxylase Tpa1-like proline 4-hydroxylase
MTVGVIQPIDIAALRAQFQSASPFPHFKIDQFLKPEFASSVAAAYPSYEEARSLGNEFSKVNERLKIQVTDYQQFPQPVRVLADALSSPEWLRALEQITGIPRLLSDEELAGGGMHLTGSGGRLDVHVDFNFIGGRSLHRRLNILIYLNPLWREEWGGAIELWDREVSVRGQSFLPAFNRCVVFETSEISYHGVTPVTAPAGTVRRSFAAYYYTREAPPGWDGQTHSTVFRARPTERFRALVAMPWERAVGRIGGWIGEKGRRMKKLVTRQR